LKLSLRSSVILLLATINLIVFGAGYLLLGQTFVRLEGAAETATLRHLEGRLETSIISGDRVRAGGILSWNRWDQFADAIVIRLDPDRAAERLRDGSGEPPGAFFNPLGSSHRAAEFDTNGVLTDIATAVARDSIVRSERGVALPIYDPEDRVWGGCWYQPFPNSSARELLRQLLPWFLLSTALLTTTLFFALRGLVLDPVRQLAEGTSRLAAGELTARLPEPRGEHELSLLVRSFNKMALEVQGYGERLAGEVEVATEKARRAEAAAMTQRRLAATGELAAGIAHEINNPLGGMLNAIEVLERKDVPEARRKEYLGLVRGGLERIRQTVGQVLRLAPRRTVTASVAIRGPLSDAFGLVRHRAEKEGVRLEIGPIQGAPARPAWEESAADFLDKLPPVQAESSEIGSAILNLIVNSLDAIAEQEAPRPGFEWVRLRVGYDAAAVDGPELHMIIEDSGPGMDSSLLERAADLFFTTKETGKGTGLGLAIVHNIVTGHGGRVQLSSEAGRGMRVDVHLPVQGPRQDGDGAQDVGRAQEPNS
jgi:signal transduction histidine kinase